MSWRQQRPTRRASAHPYIGRRMSEAEHKQQEANREAQRTGVEAEALVERMGAEYLRAEYANIRKRSEPYRRIGGVGKGAVFRAVNTGASGPDFELWLADGRAGLLELKSRKGSRVPLDAVGGAQALALRRCVSWGHLALVLVRLDGVWTVVRRRRAGSVSRRDQPTALAGRSCDTIPGPSEAGSCACAA